MVNINAARCVQVGEHLLGADFLKGKQVWLDGVDDLGSQRSCRRTPAASQARRHGPPEQVLNVPGHHRYVRHVPPRR
jgi:hypothetical protein